MFSQRVTVLWRSLVCLLLIVSVRGQSQQNCALSDSQTVTGEKNAYCKCGETLQEDVNNVDSLIIDRTGCIPYSALDISWVGIENGIKFKSITFIGTEIILMPPVTQEWHSMVRKIKFINCVIEAIPPRAFEGLTQLEELRFSNNYIGSLNSYAFSNLQNLATIEFSDSDVMNIQSYAISGLPNLMEMAFVRCNIERMSNNSIHNLRTPDLPSVSDCPNIDVRIGGGSRDERVLRDIMVRRLESTNNLPLPEFGPRLLVYKSNVSYIEESAIESNIFAFVIFAGNNIETFGKKALNVELSNTCEISSLMLVQNKITTISPDTFAFARSRLRASHETYFVMTNNTFHSVLTNGFRFHRTITIFTVADNKFSCECYNFKWHYYLRLASPSTSTTRQLIHGHNITSQAQCIGTGLNVDNFLATCNDVEFTTSTPVRVMTTINSTKISGTGAKLVLPECIIISLLLLFAKICTVTLF